MNEPIRQHDLPATYLRQFSINSLDRKLKNMVLCLRYVHSKIIIERKSVKSDLFVTENLYTLDNTEDPFAIEKFFSQQIEPRYQKIIAELEPEKNPSFEWRQCIILWLHFNKLRNSSYRDDLSRKIIESVMLKFVPEHGITEFNKFSTKFEQIGETQAKENQIDHLIDREFLEYFDKHIGAKHWLIFKAPQDQPFVASENPGFSINMEESGPDFHTLSTSFATNAAASNYFILSPKYCLVISPFYQGTPPEINISNQEIKFVTCEKAEAVFINYCTVATFKKYLISNSEPALQYVKSFLAKTKRKNN